MTWFYYYKYLFVFALSTVLSALVMQPFSSLHFRLFFIFTNITSHYLTPRPGIELTAELHLLDGPSKGHSIDLAAATL